MTQKHHATSSLARATVLIVDDEPLILRATKRELRKLGYQVISASDPEIAIAMLEVRRFDVVISDLNLPMENGEVFAVHATRTAPTTPVVVFTGEDSLRRIHEHLAEVEVEEVLPKPFSTERLESALRRAIATSHQRMQDQEGEARVIANGLVRALALRDIETENHSHRVASWATVLGREYGLRNNDLLQCELGALLHDVGKIGVPDAILRKPAQLEPWEWEEMRKHPAYGKEMVAGIPALEGASEVILNHHERWDGNGYLRGLRGKEIPVGARIFAIVDTYDAMTSDRVYRAALSHEAAVEELRRLAGIQYDPELVEVFMSIDPDMWQGIGERFRDNRPSLFDLERDDHAAA